MSAADRGPEMAGVLISLLVFALTAVALRCYTMGYLLGRLYLEDWLALVTSVCYIAYSTFGLLSIHHGLGKHVADVPESERSKALLWKYLAQVFYVLVATLVKFVVGLFLLRICSHKRWQRVTIWTLLAIAGLFHLFYIFIVIFQCQPIEFYWFRYDPNTPVEGKCNRTLLAIIPSYISLFINVVTDWTFAMIPVSFVWNSNMDLKNKISVVAVLSLGSIASLASLARIPYAKQLLSNPDYLYNFTDLAIWSTVEISLGLTASSLATLKPLFRKLRILAITSNASRMNIVIGTSENVEHSAATLSKHMRSPSLSIFKPTPRSPRISRPPRSPRRFTEIPDNIDEFQMEFLPSPDPRYQGKDLKVGGSSC